MPKTNAEYLHEYCNSCNVKRGHYEPDSGNTGE